MKTVAYITNDLRAFRDHRQNLVKFQKSKGMNIHVFFGVGEEASEVFQNQGVTLHHTSMDPHRFRLWQDINLVFLYRNLLNKIKPDIVHTITIKPTLYAGIAFILSKGRQKAGLVCTFPGLGKIFEPQSHWWLLARRKLVITALKLISRFSKAHATYENEHDHEVLRALGIFKESRSHALFGAGINLSRFKPRNISKPKEANEVCIFFGSRPLATKGILEFIDAACKVHNKNEHTRFIIAGDVDLEDRDRIDVTIELEERGLSNKDWIQYLGNVPNEEMPNLLQSADIVCLPTMLSEGFPRVLIEAAATGASLMSTDQPSIRQILKEGINGWFIDPKDTPEFSKTMALACSNKKQLLEFGKASLKIVEELPICENKIAESFDVIYGKSLLEG